MYNAVPFTDYLNPTRNLAKKSCLRILAHMQTEVVSSRLRATKILNSHSDLL